MLGRRDDDLDDANPDGSEPCAWRVQRSRGLAVVEVPDEALQALDEDAHETRQRQAAGELLVRFESSLAENDQCVVIDLRATRNLEHASVNILFRLRRFLRETGRPTAICASHEVFTLLHWLKIVPSLCPCTESLDEACQIVRDAAAAAHVLPPVNRNSPFACTLPESLAGRALLIIVATFLSFLSITVLVALHRWAPPPQNLEQRLWRLLGVEFLLVLAAVSVGSMAWAVARPPAVGRLLNKLSLKLLLLLFAFPFLLALCQVLWKRR